MSDKGGPPRDWQDVLDGPAYLINLDRRPDRLAASMDELRRAGFRDVRRFPAIDAWDSAALQRAWETCGSPRFADWDDAFASTPGRQGCFLSHTMLWQEITDRRQPFATIFEDDVVFHRNWHQLAPMYFHFTPRDYDVLFMGNQIEVAGSGLIRRTPVHCTHAYIITSQGAEKLRKQVLDDPDGVATIDGMIILSQFAEHRDEIRCPFDWYAWDASAIRDLMASGELTNCWNRNTGLVYQNCLYTSDIDHRISS
jgi:GR25 family glycosyltransferase involved in LPS biosynthesis